MSIARRNRYHMAWSDLLGVYARRSFAKNRTALCRGPAAPHQRASGSGLPRHYRSCPRAIHVNVIEHGRHRTAAGVRADVVSPRALARPEKECTDVLHAGEDPPCEVALTPVQDYLPCLPHGHRRKWLPRCPVMQVARLRWALLLLTLLGHCRAAGLQPRPVGRRWRGLACPSCGCLQKAQFPEPRLPPRQPPGLDDAQAAAGIVRSADVWPHRAMGWLSAGS